MIRFNLPWVLTSAVVSLGLAGVCAWKFSPCCCTGSAPLSQAAADWDLIADVIDVRNASVFAGACHYNGELTTAGGEALLAIAVESGSSQGVDLSGVCAAALVCGEQNLKLGSPRRSLIYVDAKASDAQRDAVVGLLRERAHGELGEILGVESAEVSVVSRGEQFAVSVGDRVQLQGVPMPDRACCKMPNLVWYEPLVPLKDRIVGFTQQWSVKEPRLQLAFQRAEENSAFVGRLSFFEGGCAGLQQP